MWEDKFKKEGLTFDDVLLCRLTQQYYLKRWI